MRPSSFSTFKPLTATSPLLSVIDIHLQIIVTTTNVVPIAILAVLVLEAALVPEAVPVVQVDVIADPRKQDT